MESGWTDVTKWRSQVISALEDRLPPAFRFDWVERPDDDLGAHSMLRVRHPVLVGTGFACTKSDPFPDPDEEARQVAAHPSIREAAESPYQGGPLPESVADVPAAVKAQMAKEFISSRAEERQRRASAALECRRHGHQGTVTLPHGERWCGECGEHLD